MIAGHPAALGVYRQVDAQSKPKENHVSEQLAPGDSAPHFRLPDAHGAEVSLSDYAGRPVIVYFYPAAATPGCTTEACDFQDNLASLAASGYSVIGISPDSPAKLRAFSEAQQLTFPLLADEDHSVAAAYGAWGEKKNYGKVYEGLIRSTFAIAPDGTVESVNYNVKAAGHVLRLRRELGVG
jgi:peroxiredoxin Q/BCP